MTPVELKQLERHKLWTTITKKEVGKGTKARNYNFKVGGYQVLRKEAVRNKDEPKYQIFILYIIFKSLELINKSKTKKICLGLWALLSSWK